MKCYKYFPGRITFNEARALCQQNGGDIAIATNLGENNFISFTFTNDNIWLGGRRIGATNNFEWTYRGQHAGDTTKFEPKEFLPWDIGQPDNAKGEESCVITNFGYRGSGKWHDFTCHGRAAGAVCELKYIDI